ncbi:hypothetical protein ASE86_00380 [Sphingomonas sp. Leaf33]|uniref:outer membrane protein assembly factor BamD n=1 Tax=Sphingomonas sp. Leaf33 TaxID=1736215 RepID=UPI0006F5DC80|nr:outer membrane protein assembly factor BamD [Sphingomonas sp. Leaf33]KQN24794.1 hypothetical protein ASE86_00380 [Sphingomonas sp. Leaf33]
MRNLMLASVAAVMLTSGAASAQVAVEGRVDRLEREMRAVQRKVFPGGAGMTVEPQITAPQTTSDPLGAPAAAPITDLTARVSALESSVRSVTGQVEQTGFRLRQLEEGFAAYKTATDARLKLLEDRAKASLVSAPAEPAVVDATGDTSPVTPPTRPAVRPTRPAVTTPAPTPAATEVAADDAAPAIERPSTGDPAEDGYTYGYRLWQAKQYAAAEKELKAVADKYPKHRRASFAQNLLGRSYLDEGKPSLASLAFYDSYKKFPEGERAPDSLYYLAQSLVKLKKPAADVCKVYTELTEVYGEKLTSGMKADIAKGRAAQKCS